MANPGETVVDLTVLARAAGALTGATSLPVLASYLKFSVGRVGLACGLGIIAGAIIGTVAGTVSFGRTDGMRTIAKAEPAAEPLLRRAAAVGAVPVGFVVTMVAMLRLGPVIATLFPLGWAGVATVVAARIASR